MALAFTDLEKGRDIVIVDAGAGSHTPRFYTKRRSLRGHARGKQAGPQYIIEHLSKWQTP